MPRVTPTLSPFFEVNMKAVKKPYFPYNLILIIFKKIRKAERVAMVDPFFLNIMTYPKPYEISDQMFAHEITHIKQVKKEGRLKFVIKYLWYNIRYGYDNNPYEIDARNASSSS